jgi:NAD(P)-dependent dehydrogenase (short-subunit alcohol dehydrogenase family)
MDLTDQIILILRGLLARKTEFEDEIFYHPGKFEFEYLNTSNVSIGDQSEHERFLIIDHIKEALSGAEIKEKIRALIDNYILINGTEPDKIIIEGIVRINIKHNDLNILKNLQNKVSIITGAAGAIGYGICRRLLEEGSFVTVSDINQEKIDQVVKDLEKDFPDQVIGVKMDVTDSISVNEGFGQVRKKLGGVDIVVINAGIALVAPLNNLDLKDFQRLEKVNVEGTLLTLSESAKNFIIQGIGGDIVLISSKNVFSPGASFGAYSATKAASHQLGRIASLEYAPYNIRVNMVSPDGVFSAGQYKSGLWQEIGPDRMKARGLDEKGLEEYYKNRNLLKTRITARHVANAVLFFVTRQTPSTGATIPVDGGLPDATPR